MISFHCGSPYAVELPDAGEGACCIGAAMHGPERCTCWKSVHDRRQHKPTPATPTVRAVSCEDCAYRPDSPERRGEPKYLGNGPGELDELAAGDVPFYCHQGIRKEIRLRHPSGVTIDGHPASYRPPIIQGVPYKANGHPADICAGWAARHHKAADD